MQSKIISVDLAKNVFQIAVADHHHHIIDRRRLSRTKFSQFLAQYEPATVLFESCGTAHYWARQARAAGHDPKIIPAQYVKPYRRRNKSDRIYTEALLEAHRCEGIKPVPVRSVEQQQLQQLHRIREQFKSTRNRLINGLRGFLRELGYSIPQGATNAKRGAHKIIADGDLPAPLASAFSVMLDDIKQLEGQIKFIEREIHQLTKHRDDVRHLRQVCGIGLLTSTATVASASSPHHFKSGRHFSSWLGITPREDSSGERRYLGRISKQGDKYLRTLFIHGARSVLARAKTLNKTHQPLNRLQRWAVKLEHRVGHNKATVALANKLARCCWAVWKYQTDFNPNQAVA